MEKIKQRNIISDKLVIEKTGKQIEDWFKLLDKKGAKKLSHSEIFDLIGNTEGLKPLGQWNQNLLTTTYEWNRKLKGRGQRDDGFEVSVSKTIEAPANILYNSFTDEDILIKWLKKKLQMRKSVLNKSLVISWDKGTTVRVELYRKNDSKTQAVVQHMKIPDSNMAEQMKKFWSASLNELKNLLEK